MMVTKKVTKFKFYTQLVDLSKEIQKHYHKLKKKMAKFTWIDRNIWGLIMGLAIYLDEKYKKKPKVKQLITTN